MTARLTGAATALALAMLGTVAVAPAAVADGALNFTGGLDAPSAALQGGTVSMTLTAQNPTGTAAYNTSFRLVLPAGVTLDSSEPAPTTVVAGPGAGETTLAWLNVADLLPGSPGPLVSLPVTLQVAGTVPLGPLDLEGQAYSSTDPRLLPVFDADGAASGAHTAYEDISTSVELVPFTITKSLLTTENELLRGVHDHRAQVDLQIDNNFVDTSSALQVVDYVPAALEFLGCATAGLDNSVTVTEEYPGSGPLNATALTFAAAAVPSACVTPSSVETLTVDPPGPLPLAVYTVVTWDSAALASAAGTPLAGDADLDAGEQVVLSYAVGIPQNENADSFAGNPTPASLGQTANLDNNTGPSTIELDGAEQVATNLAVLTGDYDDPNTGAGTQTYTDDDTEDFVQEDVSIHKSVDTGTIAQGAASTWTLLVETSEYTTGATAITVVDTVPDGLEVVGTSPAADSVVEQSDGSTVVTWSPIADLGSSEAQTLTIDTTTRDFYREGGSDDLANPVRANDAWTNSVALSAQATDLDGTDRQVQDASSAGQSAGPIALQKEVAAPDASGDCGDGTGLTWDPSLVDGFTPGDVVCWQIHITTPANLDTQNSTLTDFLPPGFAFEDAQTAPGSAITFPAPTVADSAITWDLSGATGSQDQGQTSTVVLTTRITDPAAAADGDLLGNLAKLAYQNTEGTLFQLRDQVDAGWVEPELTLTKSEDAAGPVAGGDTVGYTVEVTNDGGEPAVDVEVRDLLPGQLTCTDVVGGSIALAGGTASVPFACAADVIAGTVATIGAGATVTLTYDVLVPQTVEAGSTLTNTAGVRTYTTGTNDPTPVEDSTFTYTPSNNIDPSVEGDANTDPVRDTASVTVVAPSIDKTATTSETDAWNGNGDATPGEVVSYTVAVTLPADTRLSNAYILDTVPAEVALDQTSVVVTVDETGASLASAVTTTATQVRVDLPATYQVGATDEHVEITFDAAVRNTAAVDVDGLARNRAYLYWNSTNVSDYVDTRILQPNMDLTKAVSDASGNGRAEPGELIDYSLDVANVGTDTTPTWTSTAHDVTVVDAIPSAMVPVDGGGTPLSDGASVPSGGVYDATAGTLTWTIASIDPDTTVTLDYQLQVLTPVPSPSDFDNTADVLVSSLPGADPGERAATAVTDPVGRYHARDTAQLQGPEPSIAKSVSPSPAVPGEVVDYTVTVTVPPNVQTYAVVTDTMPAGLELVAEGGSTCTTGGSACAGAEDIAATPLTADGQTLGWLLGSISATAAERVVEITYTARVVGPVPPGTAVDGDTLTNTAEILFDDVSPGTPPSAVTDVPGLGLTGSVTTTADLDVVEPHLVLTKQVDDGGSWTDARRVVAGETVTYRIQLANDGTATAYDVAVADTTDPRFGTVTGVTGATATDTDASDGTLGFLVASIAAGDTATITYDAVVPALTNADEVVGPELTNSAVADYSSLAGADPTERTYTSNTDDASLEADLAVVGDTVWWDVDGNGVQDPGEPGVPGVDLTITCQGPDADAGAPDEVFTATTGATGEYRVEGLPACNAVVVTVDPASLPAGYSVSTDRDGGTLGTDTAPLAADGEDLGFDFGIRGDATIGDLVWYDADGDGTQAGDGSEPGLAGIGVDVTLCGLDGIPGTADDVTVSTVTAADGSWGVAGIPDGCFTVALDPATIPTGMAPVSDPDGGTADGSADGTMAGADDLTFDFGLRGEASLGDRVWLDADGDGVQGPISTEPGIPGATVQVTCTMPGGGDPLVITTTTGADGAYLVAHLPYATCTVTVTALPVALAPTYDEDSGTTAPNASTVVTLSAADSEHLTADFGYVAATGVGDLVWLDVDSSGTQDPGEPGVPGVEITVTSGGPDGLLATTGDNLVVVTTTDELGYWQVIGLPPGETLVEITGGLPAGVSQTYDDDGLGTPDTSQTTLVADVFDPDQDFGYRGANSIGDYVWLDLDADGVQDADEPGLPGVDVQVTWFGVDGVEGTSDDLTFTATTDADGGYLVDGLPNGDYSVVVTAGIPAGWAASYDETGAPDGMSTVAGLGAGGPEDHRTADFGYAGTGAICGTIWLDRELDGVLDEPSETVVPGVVVVVLWSGPDGVLGNEDDVLFTTATQADGTWCVQHMPPGPFAATVDPTTVPQGTSVVFDRDSRTLAPDGVVTGVLAPGEVLTAIDAAVRGESSIGDLVWVDEDGNGVRDPGEPGAAGVTVTLTCYGADGELGTADDLTIVVVTGSDGTYLADGLPACTYRVVFDSDTFPRDTVAYSDLDGGDPAVTTVDLGPDEDRTDVDLVLRPRGLAATGAAIGGLVALALLLTGIGVYLRRRSALMADRAV